MFVQTLYAENYRNIVKASLSFNPGCNIFFGDNGQGKTNTVEAIFLTLSGKSPRESVTSNFIGPSSDKTSVVCEVFTEEQTLSTAKISLGEGKKHFIDEEPVRSRKQLLSAYSIVFFAPEDLRIVTDSPGVRRAFMDEAISGLYPKYSGYLSDYLLVMRQRNSLLKSYSPSGESMLDVYDEQLADFGNKIIRHRIDFLKRLSRFCSVKYAAISDNSEEISFGYISDIVTTGDISDIEKIYLEALKASRREDIFTASTGVGVHHDDMDIVISGRSAKKFASRGQQRSIALAMKLSLCDMLEESRRQKPIILLDDVMSELDSSRRSRVMELLSSRQVFITCVETNFAIPPGTAFFRVSGGVITQDNT